jgi:hypothetical protein
MDVDSAGSKVMMNQRIYLDLKNQRNAFDSLSCPKITRPVPRKRIKGIIPFSLYAQKPKARHRVVLRLQ